MPRTTEGPHQWRKTELPEIRRNLVLALILSAPVWVTVEAHAASVLRGPYLQLGTPSSVVVRWRTDTATDSMVHYGTSPQSLDLWGFDGDSTTEHVVELSALTPDTRYYYSVGSASEAHPAQSRSPDSASTNSMISVPWR